MSLIFRRSCFAGTLAALMSMNAGAQSINIDFGDASHVAPDTYAAAGLAGTWNAINDQSGLPIPLVGLDGAASSATLTLIPAVGSFLFEDRATAGNESLLMDDVLAGLGDVVVSLTFDGLEKGQYLVIVYGWTPNAPDQVTWIWFEQQIEGVEILGGPWPGGLVEGITHSITTVEVTDGSVQMEMVGTITGSMGVINGIQFIRIEPEPLPGDLDGDGAVGPSDLAMLLSLWSSDGHGCDGVGPCQADLTGDNLVGPGDLASLLAAWTS
jgi:hypothetical protein